MEDVIKDMEKMMGRILLHNRNLEEQNAKLDQRVSSLEAENTKLKQRLSQYESSAAPVKNSSNSSIPPSKDTPKAQAIRRTNSLRAPSNRSSGGQVGHKGSTLVMREIADIVTEHAPDYCTSCGLPLSDIPGKETEVRQSIDIPLPIFPVVANHVRIEKKCSCGKCNRGDFPAEVKSGVSYGPNLHAVVTYLSVVQHIPFKRLANTIKDFYGIEISQGTISNMLNRMRKQSGEAYQYIRQKIEKSKVVGADETGEQLNGELHWMWTFQNLVLTYVFQHPSRGKKAIDEHFPKGLPDSTLVSDRHSSYFNMETAGHQLCLAHLLRELLYLNELDPAQQWSDTMLDLLRDTIHQRKTTAWSEIDVGAINERFNTLLEQDLENAHQKVKTLQKSLIKHKDHLFEFLIFKEAPYDNNGSERTIRPLKVKQKVSGMFKSENGADAFCQLHSIVDTTRKNNQDPLKALMAVAANIISQHGG